MIYVFLADGFEDMEAICPIDVLKRGGLEVKTVGVGGIEITSKSGILAKCDIGEDDIDYSKMEGVILPGGIPGVPNLKKSEAVLKAVKYAADNSLLVGAICAAPSILGEMGLLKGKKATCYPGFEEEFKETYTGNSVEKDGNFITAKGAGVSLLFALELLKALKGEDKAKEIADGMMCK